MAYIPLIYYSRLEKEFEQYRKESVKWSIEDFIGRAKETGYRISKAKAQDALEDMIHHHDAEYGICWTTLDYYIQQYGTKLKKK